MINIIDSTATRASSTLQDVLNDLAPLWNWKKIVYDEEEPTNVKELWVSDNIYIDIYVPESTSSKYLEFTHNINGYNSKFQPSLTKYRIVRTDNALLLCDAVGSYYIAVAKTIDLNGTESFGIVGVISSVNSMYMFTDNMTSLPLAANTSNFITSSVTQTQLIPVYSRTSDEHFVDVYYTYIRKSTDAGKGTMGGKNYYIYDCLAVPYT